MKILYQSLPIVYDIMYIVIFYYIGIFKGISFIWISYMSYNFFMKKYFNLTRISAGDLLFMWNDYQTSYNIFLVMRFDQMDQQEMKGYIIENAIKKFSKLRSKIVYKYCAWWWKEVSLEECIKRIEIVDNSKLNQSFQTLEELMNYLSVELEKRFDIENEMPYKIYLISNESNGEGLKNLVLLKCDHSLGDGMSMTSLIAGISNNYSHVYFPPKMSKEISLCQKVMIYLLLPFNVVHLILLTLFVVNKSKTPLTGIKAFSGSSVFALSEQCNFQKFSTVCRELGITFNDLMISIFSAGIKKYLMKVHNYHADKIALFSPISLKSIPKRKDDIQITNETSGLGFNIPLIDNPITECATIVKEYGKLVRNFPLFFSQKILTDWMFYFLPFYLTKFLVLRTTKGYDVVVSNVPGSKEVLTYGNSKLLEMIPVFTPGFHKVFIGILSYQGTFRMIIIFDSNLGLEPKDLLKFIEEEMDYVTSHFSKSDKDK